MRFDLWGVRPGCNDITPANHVPPNAEDVETALGYRRVFQEYDPYWAIAEVITVVGSVILVILVAAMHDRTPAPARMFCVVALGWMMIAAALTITVHLVELTVARRIEVQDGPGFSPPVRL